MGWVGKLVLAAGPFRVSPLQGEMTLSFLGRIADGYGLTVRSLLSALTEVAGQQDVVGALRGDSEVFLNAEARDRVAALCRVPQVGLRRALPAWTREEPLGPSKERPAVRLANGVEKVAGWGPACPGCVAARTGGVALARVYLAAHQRVCPRHRYWLMSVPGSGGRVVGLAGCPEVVQAQEDHRKLLRHSPVAGPAFEVAEAVTASWWAQQWPEETTWPTRLCATVPEGEEPGRWRILARGLVTYPETVAVAGVLADQTMRRRIAAQMCGHLPFCLGGLPMLISELTRCLRRPWLADRLASCMDGPLFAWAHQCSKAAEVTDGDGQRLLWKVHPAHRPRPLADELAQYLQEMAGGEAAEAPPPKRRRGHSRKADEAFEAGLLHARAYAAARGHLATRADTLQDGFPLGAWMTNQRMLRLGMSARRSAALRALDPYWDTPWPTGSAPTTRPDATSRNKARWMRREDFPVRASAWASGCTCSAPGIRICILSSNGSLHGWASMPRRLGMPGPGVAVSVLGSRWRSPMPGPGLRSTGAWRESVPAQCMRITRWAGGFPTGAARWGAECCHQAVPRL